MKKRVNYIQQVIINNNYDFERTGKTTISINNGRKAQAIQILVQSLTNVWQGIEKNKSVCGGDACILNTRIPVWSLVNDRNLGMSDAEILKAFPDLSAVDLVNAWTYADAHPVEIEQAIKDNDEVMLES
jgi:uncharacterized protein (DUF433 family)